MSLHTLANHMAQHGRGPDSMLVHMSPREVQSLQTLAKANGGTLTINPQTGLPEAGFLDSLLPMIAGFALGPAGFGLMSAFGAAATVGGITALATHDLGKGLMAGFGAWGGAGLGEGLMGVGEGALADAAGSSAYGATAGMTDAAANAAGYASAEEAAQVAAAQSMKSFDPSAMSGFDRATAGFNAATSSPSSAWDFAKNNGKSLLAATSPMLAGAGVQTTTSAPQTPSYYRPFMYDPQTQGLTALTPVSGKGIKEGGLMSLANGGAVAFADGGTTMVSPYQNAIDNPETIPLMHGETQEQGLARVQAQQTDLDERNKRRMEAAGMQVPETIEYTQSPAGLNAANPTVQTEADLKYWTDRVNAGNAIKPGLGGDLDATQATIRSLMANNPAPVGPTNAQMMAAQEKEQAELAARRAAMLDLYGPNAGVSTGPGGAATVSDFNTGKWKTVGNSEQQVQALANKMPDVPAVGGPPIDRASATGIQSLAKPDTAAAAAPSGIQLVHGSIYDPKTGRFRNPTEAEIGAKGMKEARDGVNTVSEMTALTNQYFDSYKPGEVLDFAGGTLTKNADGTATHKYTDANGKTQSYTFNRATDIYTIAKSDPAIANEWKSMFNYMAPTTNTGTTPGTVTPVITPPTPTNPSIPIPGGGGPGKSTTRSFDWQSVPIDRLPTVEQKKPEEAMSGESLAAYNALFGKGSTATKQWTTYPGRSYLPNTGQGFFVQRSGEAASSNPSGSSSSSTVTADPNTPPIESAGEGKHWAYNPTTKKWVAEANGETNAKGGMIGYATGGLGSLGGYSDGGRLLRGPGDGVSDSIPASIGNRQPARLADGEFVVPARIVSELGNGSTEAGARRLYQMMDRVQNARKKSVGKGNVAKNSRAEQYLPA